MIMNTCETSPVLMLICFYPMFIIYVSILSGERGREGLKGESGYPGNTGVNGPKGSSGDLGQEGPAGTGLTQVLQFVL